MSKAVPVALAAVTIAAVVTAAPGDRVIEERVAAYTKPLAESGFLSGCLIVARGGRDLVRAQYGYEDAERAGENDFDTRFCIASLTKAITTVAVLRLVEQKKLQLDDPIRRWIHDFPSADSISVADLITHSAGIPHRVTEPDEERQRFTPADIVARVKERGLLFPPHSRQQYSSAGYTVLAYIIERVSGMSYGDAMHELVFAPLEMNNTFHPDGRPITRRATSFVAGADGPVEAPERDYAFLAGAGSLYSTCDDVLRFARAYLDRELLSAKGWDEFHNLGWANHDVVRWSGSTNGFGSWLDIYKEDGSVYVFLGNAGTGATNILRSALPGLVAGRETKPAPRAPDRVPLTADEMRGLEGGYSRSGSSTTLVVILRDGVLHMGDNVVYPVAVDRFFNPAYFSEAEFERGAGDVATGIRITAPGLDTPLVFHRVP